MKKTSTRSSSPKRLLLALAAVLSIALPAVASSSLNRWLAENELAIVADLRDRLASPVEIGRIHYSLFKGIVAESFELQGSVHPAFPSTFTAGRIRLQPFLFFRPGPVLEWHVLFENPAFEVRADFRDVMEAGRLIRQAPVLEKWVGPMRVELRLSSIELKNGRVSLLSPPKSRTVWRQDFVGVDAFSGRHWLRGDRVVFRGQIAGKEGAAFRIRGHMKNPDERTLDTDIELDFERFLAAYLLPHLAEGVRLPDKELTASLRVRVEKGKKFNSRGRIAVPRLPAGGFLSRLANFITPHLRYDVAGESDGDAWRLTKLVVRTPGVTLKGSGEMRLDEAGTFQASLRSGALPLPRLATLFPELELESGDLQLLLDVRGSREKIVPSLDVVFMNCAFRHAAESVVVEKLDGRVRFSTQGVVVEDLWAFVNNLPVGTKGRASWKGRPRFAFSLSTFPGQLPSLRIRNPLNAEALLEGMQTRRGWNGRLSVKRQSPANGKPAENGFSFRYRGLRTDDPLRWETLARNLTEGVGMRAEKFSWSQDGTAGSRFGLKLDNAVFRVSLKKPEAVLSVSSARWCRGKLVLNARARLGAPPGWKVSAALAGADAAAFLAETSLGGGYPVSGRLDAEATLDGQAFGGPFFESHWRLRDGAVGPAPLLDKLAAQTGVEPLRRLAFRSARADVSWAGGLWRAERVKLLGEEAILSADLKFTAKGRLGGTVSARFPEASIRDSSEFKWLLKFVGGMKWVDLDFDVAGDPRSPRVEWRAGEFKKKVESRLAPWMRGILAHELEKRFFAIRKPAE